MKKLILLMAAMSAFAQNTASTFGSTYGTYLNPANNQPVAHVSYLRNNASATNGAAFNDPSLIFYMKLDTFMPLATACFPSTYLDISGNGYSGTFGGGTSNTVTSGCSGESGNPYSGKATRAATYFNNGNPSRVLASPNLALPATPSFTVMAWVMAAGTLSSGFNRVVENNFRTGFYLGTQNATQYAFIVAAGAGSLPPATCAAATSTVTVGSWQLLTGTYSYIGATSGTAKIYINGVQSGSTCTLTQAATPVTGTMSIGACSPADQTSGSCSSTSSTWNGRINSVRVYNRVLTSAEIAAIYAAENI